MSAKRAGPAQLAMVATVSLLLVLPLITHMAGLETPPVATENRALAPWPSWSDSSMTITRFPRAVDAALSDHFGFRHHLLRLGSRLFYALKVSVSPKVIIGKAGWLYYGNADDGDVISDVRGSNLYTEDQLADWLSYLQERQKWLAERNIQLLFVAVPNKHTIYPEFLPDWLRPGQITRLDQLVELASNTPTLDLVDLRPQLMRPSDTFLYHQTGTQWNKLGAFLGYQETMAWVRGRFPTVRTLTLADITCESFSGQGDLAIMLNLSLTTDTQYDCHIVGEGVDMASAPKLFLIGDSFSLYWSRFLAASLGSFTFARQPGYYPLPHELIEQAKPDLVIWQMAERFL